MSCSLSLYPDNSLVVEVTLSNPTEKEYVNDATVTVTMTDASDVDVTGETWPVSLVYVTDSNGVYRATIDPVSGIVADTAYKVIIDATGSDGVIGKWTHSVTAELRECD